MNEVRVRMVVLRIQRASYDPSVAAEKWVRQESTTLYRSQAPEVSAPPGELAPGPVRPLSICGAIAPLLFASIIVVAGSRPAYSHISQFISELGYGPNVILQNLNFVLTGMLVAAFSYGLDKRLPPGSRKGPASVTAFGIGLIGAGIFPGDPANPFVQSMHFLFATVLEISGVFAPLFVYARLKKNPGSEKTLQIFALYGTSSSTTAAHVLRRGLQLDSSGAVEGVVQRIFLTIPFLWIEAMALDRMCLPSGRKRCIHPTAIIS